MNLAHYNKKHSDPGLVLEVPAFHRRVDNGLAGGTPALPGTALRMAALLAGFLVLGLAGSLPAAPPANAPAVTDYSVFRMIADRNIFNPDRYPQKSRNKQWSTAHSPSTPAFYLVGTMNYQKGMFAFFDGNNSEYRKILVRNGVVAGYTVTEITLTGVKLEAVGKQIELKVGKQMRQDGEGKWELSDQGELPASPAETVAAPGADDTPAAGTGSGSVTSDILKKLMQKREQELK